MLWPSVDFLQQVVDTEMCVLQQNFKKPRREVLIVYSSFTPSLLKFQPSHRTECWFSYHSPVLHKSYMIPGIFMLVSGVKHHTRPMHCLHIMYTSGNKMILGCKRGPAAYMGGFGGPEDLNSEVKLYDTGIN